MYTLQEYRRIEAASQDLESSLIGVRSAAGRLIKALGDPVYRDIEQEARAGLLRHGIALARLEEARLEEARLEEARLEERVLRQGGGRSRRLVAIVEES